MTAVDERTALDVDLDADVPCCRPNCRRAATWQLITIHVLGGACASALMCDRHRRRLIRDVRRAVREGRKSGTHTTALCTRHLTTITLEWRPI